MSATKALQKAVKTMTVEQMDETILQLQKAHASEKNPMIRSSLYERIRIVQRAHPSHVSKKGNLA